MGRLRPLMSSVLIVIPVFNALEELDACLKSVARTVADSTMVLLIDDASTDPAVAPLLQSWVNESTSSRRLMTNKKNLGFVATVNIGMKFAESNVVLLNSDTEVTPGWLQQLSFCLQSDQSIATATPWSNNGEIVSLPNFCVPNPAPSDADAIATAIASCGTASYPDLPTAVGFCMAISLQAIKQLGVFDEKTFGRGYGEENDFCQRAEQAGLRNVLCDNAYVVHHGGASFGPIGLKPDENSMKRLLNKHPDYENMVSEYIRNDPLAKRREEILSCIQRAGIRMR